MIQPDYSRDISRQQAVTAASLRAWIDSPDDYKLECLLRYRERHPSLVIPRELLSPSPSTLRPAPAHPSTNAQEGVRSRRQRKPSLARLVAKAKQLGVDVTIEPDGTATFHTGSSPSATVDGPEAELKKWIAKHAH